MYLIYKNNNIFELQSALITIYLPKKFLIIKNPVFLYYKCKN